MVACNAVEGDPGAFMGPVPFWKATPMSSSEAMAIAAYAIGANHGFVYIRADYPCGTASSSTP